jgi:hypothetical protein
MRASVIFVMMSPTKISRSAVTPIDGVMILKQFYYPNHSAHKISNTR